MDHDTIREMLLTYARDPKNGALSDAYTDRGERTNPGCGDTVELRLRIEVGIVNEVTYAAQGCALSTASTALLSEIIDRSTVEHAAEVARRFLSLFSTTSTTPADAEEGGTARRAGAASAVGRAGETGRADRSSTDERWPEDLADLEIFSAVRSNPARAGCVTLPWEALLDLIESRK